MQYQFEELKVWQKGMQLVKEIYRMTKDFPKEEQYGLTGQLRRAAVSIPANLAEGKGRFHPREQIQFFYTARGSAYEVMTLLQVARDLDYLKDSEAQALRILLNEVTAMLNSLIKALQ